MSQLNTANVANPNFYTLGRGKLYFSATTAGLPTGGWRDLGNCPSFTINSEEETLEHKSSREGLAVTDKKLTISRTTNVNFQLDELSFDNLADWFSGSAVVNGTTFNTDLTAANGQIVADISGIVLNKWYEIRALQLTNDPRIYGLDTVSYVIQTDAVSPVTLDKDTDFLIDEAAGLIMFLSSSAKITTAVSNGDDIDLIADFSSSNAVTMNEVRAFSQGSVTGALKFVSINPANNDEVREWQFHTVTIASDGDLSLIGDEFSTMTFTGVVEKNEAADPDSPFVTIRGIG